VKETLVRTLGAIIFLATVAATVAAIVHLFSGGHSA
jgi:hypothetical protein